jgi:S-adenosylmethionine synthetase
MEDEKPASDGSLGSEFIKDLQFSENRRLLDDVVSTATDQHLPSVNDSMLSESYAEMTPVERLKGKLEQAITKRVDKARQANIDEMNSFYKRML